METRKILPYVSLILCPADYSAPVPTDTILICLPAIWPLGDLEKGSGPQLDCQREGTTEIWATGSMCWVLPQCGLWVGKLRLPIRLAPNTVGPFGVQSTSIYKLKSVISKFTHIPRLSSSSPPRKPGSVEEHRL